MDFIEIDKKLDEYRNSQKIKKKEYPVLVDLIIKSFSKSKDSNVLSDRILQFPIEICEILFTKHKNEIGDIKLLINNIKINNIFINNRNDISFNIACKIFSIFILDNKCIDEIYDLFNYALLMVDKGKTFNNASSNIFNKYILKNEKCRFNFFNIDFVSWSRPAKERIYNFIKHLETKGMIDLCTKEMQEWLEKNKIENQNRFPILEGIINKLKQQIVDKEKIDNLNIINNNIKIIKMEIELLNDKLRKEGKEAYELAIENTRLRNTINKNENDIINLKEDKIKKLSEIDNQRNHIEQLDRELKNFDKMAGSTKENEIFTLKNDIGNALKSEYEKFIETRESEYSEDLFEAFKARFFRIFATLKRFGIKFGD